MSTPCQIPEGGNWLKVCVSCDREPIETARRPLLGQILADRLESGLRRRGFAEALHLRRIQCLAGCQHPSNVLFGAIGKCKVRLHDISANDAEAILDLAEAYVLSPDGEPDVSKWPEPFRKRLVTLVRPQLFDTSPPFAPATTNEPKEPA